MNKKRQDLSPKQNAFIHEFVKDFHGTRAAIRAGYSKKDAGVQACRLLKHPKVAAELKIILERRTNEIDLSAQRVLDELKKAAFCDIRDAFDDDGNLKPIKELPDGIARAISAIEIDETFDGTGKDREFSGYTKKIKFWDKIKSLELLGKYLKMFVDKMEVTGKDGGPIEVTDARNKLMSKIDSIAKRTGKK